MHGPRNRLSAPSLPFFASIPSVRSGIPWAVHSHFQAEPKKGEASRGKLFKGRKFALLRNVHFSAMNSLGGNGLLHKTLRLKRTPPFREVHSRF